MKNILKKVTTGSPIIDGVLIIGLVSLGSWIIQKMTSFPLWNLLATPINTPFWLLIILLCLSVIFLKRQLSNPDLKSILTTRRYRLIFNPKDGRNKEIGFGNSGKITEGQNDNEYSWHIVWGKLEIIGADGKIYSRFRYDKSRDQFLHTNDSDTRSLKNQVIEPLDAKTVDWSSKN
jgi:hypothetical protein